MATLSGSLELAGGLMSGKSSKVVPHPGPSPMAQRRAGSIDSGRNDSRDRSSAGGSSRARSPPDEETISKDFTPSCSRCRQKKLKCDCKTPCGTCVAKGLGDECHKDRRIPRGRKRPRVAGPMDPAEEIALLRKRLAASEAQCHALRASVAPPSSLPPSISGPSGLHAASPRNGEASVPSPTLTKSHSGISSGSGQPSTSPSSPYDSLPSPRPPRTAEPPGPSLFKPRRGTLSEHHDAHGLLEPLPRKHSATFAAPAAEAAASALEAFARSGRRRTSFMQHDGPVEPKGASIAADRPHPYWSRPETYGERRLLLDRARDLLPEEPVVMELVDTFAWRANHFGGHVVNALELRREARDALHLLWHPEPRVMENLNLERLAMILLVLCISFEFHPRDKGGGPNHDAPAWRGVAELGERGDVASHWYRLATDAMALDKIDYELVSMLSLQNASLLLVYGRGRPAWQRLVLRSAIQAAQDMRLNQLGSAKPTAFARSEFPRVETGVRIWHWLCVKDWCSAQEHGVYSILPNHFNTRRPLNINDADLEGGVWQARPVAEWTELSYVLCLIDLVDRVREFVDIKLHQTLTASGNPQEMSAAVVAEIDESFHRFMESLPPFFALGSNIAIPRVVRPQRWLLQQQVFNQLLRLHRHQLSSPSARSSCLGLAHNVLSLFNMICGVCPLIDGAYISSGHLFEATCVVVLDLFLHPTLTSPEERLNIRHTVHDTLPLQGKGRPRMITRLLLEEEEAFHVALRQGRESGGPQHLKVIVDRIMSCREDQDDLQDDGLRSRAASVITGRGLMPALAPDEPGNDGALVSLAKLSPTVTGMRPAPLPRHPLASSPHQSQSYPPPHRAPGDLASVLMSDVKSVHSAALRGPPPPGWSSNGVSHSGPSSSVPLPPPSASYPHSPATAPPFPTPTGFRHALPPAPGGAPSPASQGAPSPVQNNALFEWILQQGPA